MAMRLLLAVRATAHRQRSLIHCFVWGAVGAALFSLVAELKLGALLIGMVGERDGMLLTIGIGAPCVEELFKGLALLVPLWFYHSGTSTVDGMIRGALTGLGFATSENSLYFYFCLNDSGATARQFLEIVAVRNLLDAPVHAAFTASLGAILGCALSRHPSSRPALPLVGLAFASVQHVFWNAAALALSMMRLPG
jgi:RsiW-degrading membrane proteinase PrsW (M82 family)